MEGDPITPLRRAFSTPPLPRQRTHYVIFWGAGVDDDEYPPSKKDCSLARGALGEIRPAEQGHRARGNGVVTRYYLIAIRKTRALLSISLCEMESARPPLLPSKKIKRGARSMVQMKTMSRSINPDPFVPA